MLSSHIRSWRIVRSAHTGIPGKSTGQNPLPDAMSTDQSYVQEGTTQPPASSKKAVSSHGHSDSDSASTDVTVPMTTPVTRDQNDQMSTDSKMSGLSHDSTRKGSVTTVPSGPHTIISTRAIQLDLEDHPPSWPWKQGSSARNKFEK